MEEEIICPSCGSCIVYKHFNFASAEIICECYDCGSEWPTDEEEDDNEL